MFIKECGLNVKDPTWKAKGFFGLMIVLSQIFGAIIGVVTCSLAYQLDTSVISEFFPPGPNRPGPYIT